MEKLSVPLPDFASCGAQRHWHHSWLFQVFKKLRNQSGAQLSLLIDTGQVAGKGYKLTILKKSRSFIIFWVGRHTRVLPALERLDTQKDSGILSIPGRAACWPEAAIQPEPPQPRHAPGGRKRWFNKREHLGPADQQMSVWRPGPMGF